MKSWQKPEYMEEADRAISAMLARARKRGLKPPPRLTISQWADTYRKLSAEASAEPGQWSTSRAEYLRGIMDAVSDPQINVVVVMSSAQVGKSETLLNIAGYYMSQDASPMMLFQPTIDMAESFSKDRIAPMLRDCPVFEQVHGAKAKETGNTLLHKSFPGGHITLAGANSPASLASRPVRVALFDEIDRYPASAGTEGDPVSLGVKRTNNFWNRVVVMVSTPTVKGASRIETAYNETDQRRFFVPCVHCGHEDYLRWANVRFDKDNIQAARYICTECGAAMDDHDRVRAVRRGRWVATSQAAEPGKVGFHVNELYSPWRKLHQIVADFLSAKKSPDTLKTWINTSLGETWEAGELLVAASDLAARAENYPLNEVPHGPCLLTCGVDVQDDRIEFAVWAWGEGEESWVVDSGVILGNTTASETWEKLDEYINTPIMTEFGHQMRIVMTAIDSGGHRTQYVYNFARSRASYVMAVKGASTPGKPVISPPTKQDVTHLGVKVPNGVALWLVGTDVAKHTIHARLKINQQGPGYIHFSNALPVEYYEQLTAERLVTKFIRGVPVANWVKTSGRRNEQLDCAVYAYAAAVRAGVPRMPTAEWARARNVLAENLRADSTTALPAPQEDRREVLAVQSATQAAPAQQTPRRRESRWLGSRSGSWL